MSIPKTLRVRGGTVLFLLLFAVGNGPGLAADRKKVAEAERLIEEAFGHGASFLRSDNKKEKKQAKEQLARAESILQQQFNKHKNCEPCAVHLSRTRFYQAYFGIDRNYKQCIATVEKARERFPDNPRLALVAGYAYHNREQWSESIKSLKEFLILSEGEPEREAQAQQFLESAQEKFLSSWYQHAEFYGSKDAKFTRMNPQTFVNETVFEITPQWENQVGQQAFQQMTAKSKVVQDPELQRYLERLVARMVEKTPGPFPHYRVTVVDDPSVNAVTTPGHVVVFTGLIGFAENESELVGVLAHELAHNYGHHAGRKFLQAVRSEALAESIVTEINPETARGRLIADLTSKIAVDLFIRAYTRMEERQADHYGSHIAFNAGYDPTSMSTMFLKMYKANPKQGIRFLRTHPPMPKRIEYVTEYLENFPLERELRSDTEDFQKIKARLFPQHRQRPGEPPAEDRKGLVKP
jgi:predicted Zn-dependent protease